MSKLIYAASLASFKSAYPDWSQTTSPVYLSIGYTADGYLYTHGKLFKMSIDGADNPWGLDLSLTDQSLEVTVAGHTSKVLLPIIDITTTTEDDLSISKSAGIYTAIHKKKFETDWLGTAVASNTTIGIPKLTVSKTGHITSGSNVTATLNHVLKEIDTSSITAYLLFGLEAGTSGTKYNTNLRANLATGDLYAADFYEDGKSLASIYAPIMHANTANIYGTGNATLYGHVKLSDVISSTSNSNQGVAATPKAILDSLNAAKAYAKELLGTTDAMIFVGTLNGSGVIQSHNTVVIPTGVIDGTTNISALTTYSAGWTFKVTTVGTITGIGKVEPGDMLVASSNYVTAYKATDWTVIQANIDGAVSIATNLVANTVTLGASATTVKSLVNGISGQYLMINSTGIPSWTSVASLLREIKVNGVTALTPLSDIALNLQAGTGISLTAHATNGNVTVVNTGVLDTYALSILNGATNVWSYQPKTAAKTITINRGLEAVATATDVIVGHSTSSPVKAAGLYEMSVDAYGHVVAGGVVTSLPTPANFLIVNASGIDISNFNGSVAKRLKFANGTDITLNASAVEGLTTITPSITHRYRGISFQGSGITTPVVVFSNTAAGTVTFKAGSNMDIVNTAGVLTLNSLSTNTWRNIKAIIAGTTAVTEVLSTSVGADLEFGSDFLWTESGNNGKLQIGWADIDATGNITYVV